MTTLLAWLDVVVMLPTDTKSEVICKRNLVLTQFSGLVGGTGFAIFFSLLGYNRAAFVAAAYVVVAGLNFLILRVSHNSKK